MTLLLRQYGKASFMPGDTNWPYCYDSGNRRQAAFSNLDPPVPSLRNIVIVRGEVFDGALGERIDTELRYLARAALFTASSLGCV
ncbi:hypothetical protein [Rhizobium lusitanum]|uniref:hypothetical protein n=1 Tax=Rhizobium lusitanum TaxID=293958 RepID=UPI00195A6796|nr:hypothetical protein [Rhizobium lusitanum]MBM7049449.1 hypothetical protein [Rhizobium lusitanum]